MKRPLLTITIPFRSTWFLIPFGILLTFFLVRGEGTIHYTQVLTCAAASLVVGVISGILSSRKGNITYSARLGDEILVECDFWGIPPSEFCAKALVAGIAISRFEQKRQVVFVTTEKEGMYQELLLFTPISLRGNDDI